MAAALRHEDWQIRLDAFITSVRDTPFKWGVHDCGLFAADCVLVLTGIDPASELRGKYDDEASAARALGAGGLRALADRLAAHYGFAELEAPFAQRGDIVLFDIGHPTLGVCVGPMLAGPGAHGLVMVRRSRAVAAWRVG